MIERARTKLFALSCACAALMSACSSSSPGAKAPGTDPAPDAAPTSAAPADGESGPDGAPKAGDASANDASGAGASSSAAGGSAEDTKAGSKSEMPEGNLGGELSQSDIQRIVEQNVKLFDACYPIASGGKKTFAATVEVKATIGPSGAVTAIQALKSSDKNKKLEECITGAFQKIKFPKPVNGATSVIKYPMKLEGSVQ